MPRLSPLRPLRYSATAGDPADVLAPPYDVIDEALAAELRARSRYNAIHLVLPEGEPPECYAAAASRLDRWIDQGVLVEEASPGLFVYRQTFSWGGTEVERVSCFGGLELTPFDGGEVLPHEETHRGPKQDRLALTLACRAQLSSVFLIARDPEGELAAALAAAETSGSPVLVGTTPDGIGHRLVKIDDPGTVDRIGALAGGHPLLMADGHHRYETALAVREALAHVESTGTILACFASERDPGLLVLPTHRALSTESTTGDWMSRLGESFELDRLAGDPAELAAAAAEEGREAMVAVLGGEAAVLRPRPEAVAKAGIEGPETRIAAVVFDRLVLRRTLDTDANAAAADGALTYHRDPDEAVAAAGAGGAAFLLPAVAVEDVRESVSRTGRRLPAKSTYFAPKIPSGLLFRRI